MRCLPVELVNPRFYHLDTCFCPLAPGVALFHPAAFDAYGRRVLASHVGTLIEVPNADAARFGCNAVAVGKTVIHNAGCAGPGRRPEPAWVHPRRCRVGRVFEGGRQCQVSDPSARRGGRSRLAGGRRRANGPIKVPGAVRVTQPPSHAALCNRFSPFPAPGFCPPAALRPGASPRGTPRPSIARSHRSRQAARS